ncbi:hypothetical protein [Embleya sp. NPDC005971]|uniref:hypothetical protein n=1 Tax=Embleya sp. NPDC005971 TaxID=3156724 RepID=UPI00340DEC7E
MSTHSIRVIATVMSLAVAVLFAMAAAAATAYLARRAGDPMPATLIRAAGAFGSALTLELLVLTVLVTVLA